VFRAFKTGLAVSTVALGLAAGCGDDDHGGAPVGGTGGTSDGESGQGGDETRAGTGGHAAGKGGSGGGSAGAALGGEAGSSQGGTSGASGEAGSGQGGASGASGQAGSGAGEAGAAGAPSDECVVGRTRQGVFDESGGSLELCGAALTMPAGVLEDARTVSLSIVALPSGAPGTLEAGGPAFQVDVEGELPASDSAPLYVIVPHAETSRYVYLYVHAGETWNYVEACTREDDRIGQEAWSEGVFVALVETEDFPASVMGLGSGSVAVDFDGASSTFDLDADAIETHAIYDGMDDIRSVTLSATKEGNASSLERLRIDFAIDGDGVATLVQVTYGSTADVNGFWSYLPFFPQSAQVELTRDQGSELTGSVQTELTQGEAVRPFSADFDVTVEKFRYPPEGYCNLPEGDPN
jgi:hypothetical protein